MDIGFVKVIIEEMKGIKYYLIDVIFLDVLFLVVDFKEYGDKVLSDIISRNKFFIIVGGIGFYINLLICNMIFIEVEKDDEYRDLLEYLVIENGNDYIYEMFKECDFISYKEIYKNNRKRVIRVLEVFKFMGKLFSFYDVGDDFYKSDYDVYYYVLIMDR